jgi:hypothetical protein
MFRDNGDRKIDLGKSFAFLRDHFSLFCVIDHQKTHFSEHAPVELETTSSAPQARVHHPIILKSEVSSLIRICKHDQYDQNSSPNSILSGHRLWSFVLALRAL